MNKLLTTSRCFNLCKLKCSSMIFLQADLMHDSVIKACAIGKWASNGYHVKSGSNSVILNVNSGESVWINLSFAFGHHLHCDARRPCIFSGFLLNR